MNNYELLKALHHGAHVCSLFCDAVRISDYTVSIASWSVNNYLEIIYKDAIMA
jgi:hypothetical protein